VLQRLVAAGFAAFARRRACCDGAARDGPRPIPTHPSSIMVPFATGGPADVYARFIAQRLGDALGQAIVVDNRPAPAR
jgi:tripartite-type tricarboxylate transporter receptor subunit TctC